MAWETRLAAVLLAVVVVAGCTNSQLGIVSGEDAIAALSKGDFARAETLSNKAIQRNPQDPYAVLALAVVYQNTGRPELARRFYEALVRSNPQDMAIVGVGPNAQPRTIAAIAAQSLAQMNSPGRRPGAADALSQPSLLSVEAPPPVNPVEMGVPDDTNVILRFQTLRRLLDEKLITREEYNQRRGANLGALLRYTAAPPAADLGRPAPAPERVIDRLRYLATAFDEGSISAREQMAERGAILQALLPLGAVRRADAPGPVTDQMGAAAVVGRLERLRESNVITSEEQTRERDAVYRSAQAYAAQSEAAARAAAGMMPPASPPSGPGVRLSLYRSEDQARSAWAYLQSRHSQQLQSLQPVISKVTLRRPRGTFYRLSAGPVSDKKAATSLCRYLRQHRQSCQPVTLR